MILISETLELSFGSTNKSVLNSFLERWLDRIWWSRCLVKLSDGGRGHAGRSRDAVQVETEWRIFVRISIYGFCSDIRWISKMIWYDGLTDGVMFVQTRWLSAEPCWWIAKKMISGCRSLMNDLTNCDWCWSIRRFWLDARWWYPRQWYRGRHGRDRWYDVHVRGIAKSLVLDLSL